MHRETTPRVPGLDGVVFVVGNSRSGTTMTGRIIAAHDRAYAFRELHFFGEVWPPAAEAGDGPLDPATAETMMFRLLRSQRVGHFYRGGDEEALRAEARQYLAAAPTSITEPADVLGEFLRRWTRDHGASIAVEQTPRNIFYVDEILRLFPEARIVIMVRDPRAVLLSQKGKWKRRSLGEERLPRVEPLRSRLNYHPVLTSQLWKSAVSTGDRYAGHDRVHQLRFEDLLDDPEHHVRSLCAFLGLAYQPQMLQVPVLSSSNEPDAPGATGIRRERAEKWRDGSLSRTEIWMCERSIGPLMERHGYALTQVRPEPLRALGHLAVLPVQVPAALLANRGRLGNVTDSVRRRLLAIR